MKLNKTIILVHPFTSEHYLYARVKEFGYRILTLVTEFDTVWIKECMPTIEAYSDCILTVSRDAAADLPQIEQAIKQNNMDIVAVLNCFDSSIYYSDCLANHFLNLNIDTEFSRKRIDKYEVNKALEQAGVRSIKSVLIHPMSELNAIKEQVSALSFPIIIKPTSDSAARNDVVIVNTHQQLEKEISRLSEKSSIFHAQKHSQFLLQQYIIGEEFSFNTAVINGQQYVSSMFKYRKQDKKFYGVFSIDEHFKQEQSILAEYNKQCLDALKVTYGLIHGEFIITEDKQPYLIEMNNRLTGSETLGLSQVCYHSDELTNFLRVLQGKQAHIFDCQNVYSYGAVPYLANYYNPNPSRIDTSGLKSYISTLPFYPGVVAEGQPNELFTKITTGLLMHNANKQQLEKEVDILFEREQAGTLFV